MRPLIGVLASALPIAGRSLFFAVSTTSPRDAAGRADRVEPGRRSVNADRGGADDRAPGKLELAHRGGVERMDGGDRGAVERAIEFAPFARRHDRPRREAEQIEHRADLDRIGREHLSEQRDRRLLRALPARRLDGALLGLAAGRN